MVAPVLSNSGEFQSCVTSEVGEDGGELFQTWRLELRDSKF